MHKRRIKLKHRHNCWNGNVGFIWKFKAPSTICAWPELVLCVQQKKWVKQNCPVVKSERHGQQSAPQSYRPEFELNMEPTMDIYPFNCNYKVFRNRNAICCMRAIKRIRCSKCLPVTNNHRHHHQQQYRLIDPVTTNDRAYYPLHCTATATEPEFNPIFNTLRQNRDEQKRS